MFFSSPAYAQAAGAATGGASSILVNLLPMVAVLLVFYFLLIRPQQKRMSLHQQMIASIAKGDTVVTSGGFIGKVKIVGDAELSVELAPNVVVKVLRHTISEVRGKDAPANDVSKG